MERYIAAALVFGVAGNELLHAILDGMNPSPAVANVSEVISMSATAEPDSWRAIHSPMAAVIFYGAIWLAHAVSGLVGLLGSYLLLGDTRRSATDTERATHVSIVGVGVGAILYLVGFLTIASGWFLIHTSPTPPNYLPNAERLFLVYMAVLLYLTVRKH